MESISSSEGILGLLGGGGGGGEGGPDGAGGEGGVGGAAGGLGGGGGAAGGIGGSGGVDSFSDPLPLLKKKIATATTTMIITIQIIKLIYLKTLLRVY